MSNMLQVISDKAFGDFKFIDRNGELWFEASCICNGLNLSNPRSSIALLDADEKDVHTVDTPGGKQKVNIISEAGMYSLLLRSRKKEGKAFARWVTHDVIPAIRKHGAYMTPKTAQSILDNPDNAIILAKALLEEHEKRLAAERQSEALQLTNSMLSQQINTWDERKVTNALVRAYGNRSCGGNFQAAWNTLYKRLEYKRGINIRARRTKSSDDLWPLINFIRPSEWPAVMSVAASLCIEAHLEPSEVIGIENAKRYLVA